MRMFLRLFEITFFLAIFCVAGFGTYWLFLEKPPLTVTKGAALTPTVAPGGVLQVEYDSNKTRQCPAKARYFIRDGAQHLYVLPGASGFNPVGEGSLRRVSYKVKIPSDAEPGSAEFWETVTYKCNPLRSHVVVKPRLKFTITARR